MHISKRIFTALLSILLVVCSVITVSAQEDNRLPARPGPPKLVNDLAGMIATDRAEELETKLVDYDNTSSVQIAIVTVPDLQGYEESEFAVKLFNKWQIGQKGKENGVLILVSREEHKVFIATGRAIEGVLTDLHCDEIIRREMVPEFKKGDYYAGFDKAADAIIAVTKGEYKSDGKAGKEGKGDTVQFIIAIIVLIILAIVRGGGNNRRGKYMSGRGAGNVATGFLLGSLLGGGGRGGGWGDSGGGGGFGGFGGGSSSGGGAGGSW